MSDKVIYTVGGTVQAGGGIYISRDADEELLRLCRDGEFCYVLTGRQMGKSSLMVATMERLATKGIRSVEIDLTKMGTELSGLTAEQWYLGLIELIVDQLDLDVEYMDWWDERARLGPTQRLSQFLRQVVLEQVSEPVVIFIDEVDSTLNLDFTDDFFAAIRACYNARASDPVFKRLSFVLLGVATPGDLISHPQRTPFNIGRRIDLTDFTERQAIPLADGLGLSPVQAGQVLAWILDWTGGHPYLTQRLCAAAAASPTKNWDAVAVDRLVAKTFFGEHSAQDSNLRFVRDMLTQRAPDKADVLKTYRRIRAGKAVPDEERSQVKTHLKLSGIVKAEDGYLHIRNEIYRRVFDLAWVRANTAINWAPIVAGISTLIALLAIVSILYNAWVGIQAQDCIANFYQTNAPEERVAHLVKLFRLQRLLGPTDYGYKARELFYGLPREEQLALFTVNDIDDSDLIVLIQRLYITLADVDGTDGTRPLLEVMVNALDYRNETEETKNLQEEIINWLNGREYAKQDQHTEALVAYDEAIRRNGDNPATLYERARVFIALSEYRKALSDLDRVVVIAGQVLAPTPTVTPIATLVTTLITTPIIAPTTASTPVPPAPTPLSTSTPTSTSTPSAAITSTKPPPISVVATPTPASISTATPPPTTTVVPAPITSEFATTGQMISAVRKLIYGDPNLVSSLANAPSSEYPNLREFGLVPTPTFTPAAFSYQVIVKVTDTDELVQDARVTIEVSGKPSLDDITDSEGVARLFIDSSYAGQPGVLSVEATEYERHSRQVDLIEGALPDVVQLEQVVLLSPTLTKAPMPTDTPTPIPTAAPLGISTRFADGFESGDLSAWSGMEGDEEDLRVNGLAARFGGAGLEVVIDDVEPRRVEWDGLGDLTEAYARFYFAPNGLRMAAGDTFVLAQLSDRQERSARMELGYDGVSYRLRFGLYRDSGGWLYSEWVPVSDEWHAVEFSFEAASALGADDGRGAMWLDGSLTVTLSGVDNDTRRVDRLYLGPLWGLDAGTAGSLYFDQVKVDPGYIGLEEGDARATPELTDTPTVTPTVVPTVPPANTPTNTPLPTGTPTHTPTSASPRLAKVIYVQSSGQTHHLGLVTSTGQVLNYELHLHAAAPAWSPDGTKIAFFGEESISTLGGIYELGTGVWIIDDQGKTPTQIVQIDHVKNIAWSPDGTKLAFEFGFGPLDMPHKIMVVDSKDGQLISGFAGEQPAWSPDSQRLVIKACLPDCGLWQVNSDGRGRQQITFHKTDSYPAWSPDDQYLAFTSERDGNWDIYLLRLADGELRRLTNRPGTDTTPVFSQDGQEIYLRTDAFGGWRITVMTLDGRSERLVKEGVGPSDDWGLARPAVH